jgi:hypothetical protein
MINSNLIYARNKIKLITQFWCLAQCLPHTIIVIPVPHNNSIAAERLQKCSYPSKIHQYSTVIMGYTKLLQQNLKNEKQTKRSLTLTVHYLKRNKQSKHLDKMSGLRIAYCLEQHPVSRWIQSLIQGKNYNLGIVPIKHYFLINQMSCRSTSKPFNLTRT